MESRDHEKAKEAAVEVFRRAGWLVRDTEIALGPGVRVDALGVRPPRADGLPETVIAMEVQLSHQGAAETELRDRKLRDAIEARWPGVPQARVWAFGDVPPGVGSTDGRWILDLRQSDPGLVNPAAQVEHVADLLAKGRVTWREAEVEQVPVTPIPAAVKCPSLACREESPVVVLAGLLVRSDLVRLGADAMPVSAQHLSDELGQRAVDRCLQEVADRLEQTTGVVTARASVSALDTIDDPRGGHATVFRCPCCKGVLPRPIEAFDLETDPAALKRAEWDFPVADATVPVRFPGGWRGATDLSPGIDPELVTHHTGAVDSAVVASGWRNRGFDPRDPSKDIPDRDRARLRASLEERKRLLRQPPVDPERGVRPLTAPWFPDPQIAAFDRGRVPARAGPDR